MNMATPLDIKNILTIIFGLDSYRGKFVLKLNLDFSHARKEYANPRELKSNVYH